MVSPLSFSFNIFFSLHWGKSSAMWKLVICWKLYHVKLIGISKPYHLAVIFHVFTQNIKYFCYKLCCKTKSQQRQGNCLPCLYSIQSMQHETVYPRYCLILSFELITNREVCTTWPSDIKGGWCWCFASNVKEDGVLKINVLGTVV